MLRQFLPLAYPVNLAYHELLRTFGRQKPQLRVLLYHDVSPGELNNVAATLRWLQDRWIFLSPQEFESIISGRISLNQDALLLTFDDGFASNRIVAEEVLKPLGIQAIFFVVTDFIDQPDIASARAFICERLKVASAPALLSAHYQNMNWADLARLLDLGHSIGAHTNSHERLTSNVNMDLLHKEVIGCADRIESELSTHVRHFAFPFGNFASFSQPAMELAKTRFDFIHSGLRGNNYLLKTPYAIRRESLKPDDHRFLVGALVKGASDFRYRRFIKILDQWASGQV